MTAPAIPTEDSPTPRAPVTPTINGVSTPEILISGDLSTATDQPLVMVRYTLNPGDKLTASGALKDGAPYVEWLMPGEAVTVRTDTPIRQIALIGVGSGAQPADYTGGSFVCSASETDQTDWLAQLALFEFLGSETVLEARLILSDTYSSGLASRLKVQGINYA